MQMLSLVGDMKIIYCFLGLITAELLPTQYLMQPLKGHSITFNCRASRGLMGTSISGRK